MQASRPLNILHVITSLDPAAGGPPNVLTRLAAAQALLGHEVSTISIGGPGISERVEKDLAKVPGNHLVKHQYIEAGISALKHIAHQVFHFDILHLHGVWDSILYDASAAASISEVPYIIAPHGMLDPWSLSQKKLKKKIALMLWYRRMLNDASALHLLNVDEEDLIAPLNLTCDKHIIPNGIFLDEIDPLPEKGSFYRKHPELNGKPYILFLGRLHYKKGLDYLASAFTILAKDNPDVHLVVAGPDDGERAGFEEKIRASNLSDRVHLVGPLFGRDKIEAYVDATVFTLPSRQEGFSIAIVEAMACRVPVVISKACHFPEVQQARAGIVTDLIPQQIADAFKQILSSPDTSAGQSGRTLVETNYTWLSVAKRSIEVYCKYL